MLRKGGFGQSSPSFYALIFETQLLDHLCSSSVFVSFLADVVATSSDTLFKLSR